MTEQTIWNPDTGITGLKIIDSIVLGDSQIPGIKAVWESHHARLRGSSQLAEFTEQLNREWAVETGVIENLYDIDRGTTQTLIEHGFKADLIGHGDTNKPHEYVLQLLNDQKAALEGIFIFVKNERELSTSYIKELHAVMLRSQDKTEAIDSLGNNVEISLIKGKWKTQINYPVRDGVTYKYCPPEQTASEMDRLIEIHKEQVADKMPSEVQAAWLHHRFTQIHPFQDGNGRIARALASIILIKDGLFPMLVVRDDKPKYIKTLEAADNGDIKPLIDLIVRNQRRQFQQAMSIVADGVQAALDGMLTVVDRRESLKRVYDLANLIEDDIIEQFQLIKPKLEEVLQKISDETEILVSRNASDADDHLHDVIFEHLIEDIGYFFNAGIHESWIILDISWSHCASIAFIVHGFGESFNGSLMCTSLLYFEGTDKKGGLRITCAPLTTENFVFFYNEDQKRMMSRFQLWREGAIAAALREITLNL